MQTFKEDYGKQHRPGWPERSMLAQSRLLAMRKLSFRESGVLNQSGGTATVGGCEPCAAAAGGADAAGGAAAAGAACGVSCAAAADMGWSDIDGRVGVWSGVVSLFGTASGAASASKKGNK